MRHPTRPDSASRSRPNPGATPWRAAQPQGPTQAGFGLIEVLLVISLVGIGLGMTLPDRSHQQTAHALRAVVHDYRASLLYARRQASALNSPVTVCPSSDGQRCGEVGLERGWIVRAGWQHESEAPLLRDHPPQPSAHFQTRWAQSAKHITFLPNGLAQGGSLRRINLCPTQAEALSLARALVINQAARLRIDPQASC